MKKPLKEMLVKIGGGHLLNEKFDPKKLENDPLHQWVTGSGKLTKFKDEIHQLVDSITELTGKYSDDVAVTKKFLENINDVDAYDYFKDAEMKAEALKQLKSSYPKVKKYLSDIVNKKLKKLDVLVKKMK